jgi:hypothetical protein
MPWLDTEAAVDGEVSADEHERDHVPATLADVAET